MACSDDGSYLVLECELIYSKDIIEDIMNKVVPGLKYDIKDGNLMVSGKDLCYFYDNYDECASKCVKTTSPPKSFVIYGPDGATGQIFI